MADSQRERIEQRGLWFEEFDSGVLYAHRPGRTLTEADNVLFTTLTMNSQALHLDEAWSVGQPFGHRLVNSLLTLSIIALLLPAFFDYTEPNTSMQRAIHSQISS